MELPTPAHFEQAADMITEEDVAEKVVCGPDPERHLAEINKFLDAGYNHVLHPPDRPGSGRLFSILQTGDFTEVPLKCVGSLRLI